MHTDSPFYRASSAASGRSTPSRQNTPERGLSGELPFPRRSSGAAPAAERSRLAQDRFEALDDRDQGRAHYDRRSREALRSVQMMPVAPVTGHRGSQEGRASLDRSHSRSVPSSESDKPTDLRTRSRIELENFRRQAARRTRLDGSRAVSAPGGMGTIEDLPTMPERRGVNVQVVIQRDTSQQLSDTDDRTLRRRSTLRWPNALTPDTNSKRYKYAVLAAQSAIAILLGAASIIATYLSARNTGHIADNRQAIDQITGAAPPPL